MLQHFPSGQIHQFVKTCYTYEAGLCCNKLKRPMARSTLH